MNETSLRNSVANYVAEEARGSHPLALAVDERDELRRLRKENSELRVERDILRKAAAYFAQDDPVCRHRFVHDQRDAYSVKRLCQGLGVSRAGH